MKIEKTKKVLIALCIILIVALIYFLLIVNFEVKTKSNSATEENVVYNEFISYDNLFSISAPESWQVVAEKNSLNENAIIELKCKELNAFLVVVVNSKVDLNEGFDTYKTNVFKQKETVYGTKITRYVDVVIDEHQAQYGEIYYTNVNNINTYIRAYALETDNYYGQIVIWTIASNEQLVQEEFNNITLSFKEIKN